MSRNAVRIGLLGLQFLVLTVAVACVAGLSTTTSVALAQMDPPPMDPLPPPPPPPPMDPPPPSTLPPPPDPLPPPTLPPPTSPPPPYPQFSGSWTEADPFTTTLFFGEDYKTVNEQWTETTTGDNLAHEQHNGLDYAAGESWIRGSQGDVTFCYQRYQGTWVLVNCMGVKEVTKDADTQAIERNVDPWVQYFAEDSYNFLQHNLIVTAPATMFPGQPVVDADFALISHGLEQGHTWDYLGVAMSSWDYQMTLPGELTVGWMEQYEPVENGVQVTHTEYWIEYEGGAPVQREKQTVMIRPQ